MAARRGTWAAKGLAIALGLLVALPAAQAQNPRSLERRAPSIAQPSPQPPALRSNPPLPNYYLDRGGPVTAPKGPVGANGVTQSLQARGFRDIGPIQQRGNTVIVPHATGPSGEKVQLVIGPNGDILGVRVLGEGRR